ncbi:hypothetical protein D5125_09330 [Magnetovirga frankeli]|uniref:hypothetical protein n=1 Tax=Magnetovirga frankeli TaxID=947516 RepID=UPI001293AB80|nr:hypothetical protein D5125_09330 [gamma proteobacterium SS-5]
MLTFKSAADLRQLPTSHPAYNIIADLVQRLIVDWPPQHRPYNPEDDGYIVLIEEEGDQNPPFAIWPDDPTILLDLRHSWEGIMSVVDGYWQAVFLANNECGFVFIIPDAPWITGELRQSILDNLDTPWEEAD